MPVLVGTDRVVEDLHGQRRRRLIGAEVPVLVVQRGEQQRRRLARRPRYREQDRGHDPAERRPQHYAQRSPPLWNSQREGGFAQRSRHQPHQLFRAPGQRGDHQHGQRDSTGERGEAAHRQDHQAVGNDSDHDRRDAGENLGREADRVADAAVASLGEKDSRADAERDADQARDADDVERSGDRIAHAAARLADRRGNGGEEIERQPSEPVRDHQPEQRHERHQRDGERQPANAGHDQIHCAPLGEHHAATRAGPRRDIRTRTRAAMLSSTVTAKRRRPRAARAPVCISPLASANSLAMTAGSEYPGANNEARIVGEFPMTIVTAIVSPSARPSPSMVAPTIPARA